MHHWMLAVCQKGMLQLWLECVANGEASRAAMFATCATVDGSLPLMSMVTLPCDNCLAAVRVIMCSALVLVAELGSDGRSFGGKQVVLTNKLLSAEWT